MSRLTKLLSSLVGNLKPDPDGDQVELRDGVEDADQDGRFGNAP